MVTGTPGKPSSEAAFRGILPCSFAGCLPIGIHDAPPPLATAAIAFNGSEAFGTGRGDALWSFDRWATSSSARFVRRRTKELPLTMKYNHIGIPTTSTFDGEIPVPRLKVTVSDHKNNPFAFSGKDTGKARRFLTW